MRAKRSLTALALAILLAAALANCSGDDDAPGDAGAGDAGPPRDAGARPDAGSGMDSGAPPDAGPGDAGSDADLPPPCVDPTIPPLATEDVAAGHRFVAPIFVTQAPGSTDTLWVVERGGRIMLVRGATVLAAAFLDISASLTAGGEQGLLGLAFHPGYATNGRFFVYYTSGGDAANVIAEYRRSAGDPDRADPTEVRRLVHQADFAGNHNGGMLTFGPDGFLYAALGDGGGACDPAGSGQDRATLLGKLLRLDVDNEGGAYAAAGNPFSGATGLPQIWSYGLRNPWRFSIDRRTGDIYIGDVGQDVLEEVDFEPRGGPGGANYGWSAFEGDSPASITCPSPDVLEGSPHTPPVVVVDRRRTDGPIRGACAVTGGYVYRGRAIPSLSGVYVFGDFCSTDVAAFRYCDGAVHGYQRVPDLGGVGDGLASFGQDEAGELYMVFVVSGEVRKIVPR